MTTTSTAPRLNKPAFFEDLEYTPHPGQEEVHNSIASRRILACGVRWGKTRCAAMEGLAAAMEPRKQSRGWVVAPNYDLADKVFRELVVLVAEHLRHRIVTLKENERRIILRNMSGGMSELRGKSADNAVSLLGEGLNWLVIDEAARLKPSIWQSHLTQRLIDHDGWALLISTPAGKNWFYHMFRRGQGDDPAYKSWNSPSWQNPHLNPSLIEDERERLPQRIFQQEFAGEFVEGSGQVFRHVREAAVGDWKEPIRNERYYCGVDLAKVEDHTVVVIMNSQREVVFVDRFHRIDWSIQIQRIKAATDRYNRASILIDSTGSGEPIFEAVAKAGCRVEPFVFTMRSKSALIDRLALALEKRELILPRAELWPQGVDELESYLFSVSETGNVKSSAPSGASDDCVMALALAVWQIPDRPQTPDALIHQAKLAFRLP